MALQGGDGTRTYASRRLTGVGAEWRKFPFTLTADGTDHGARFGVWIDRAGAVWGTGWC